MGKFKHGFWAPLKAAWPIIWRVAIGYVASLVLIVLILFLNMFIFKTPSDRSPFSLMFPAGILATILCCQWGVSVVLRRYKVRAPTHFLGWSIWWRSFLVTILGAYLLFLIMIPMGFYFGNTLGRLKLFENLSILIPLFGGIILGIFFLGWLALEIVDNVSLIETPFSIRVFSERRRKTLWLSVASAFTLLSLMRLIYFAGQDTFSAYLATADLSRPINKSAWVATVVSVISSIITSVIFFRFIDKSERRAFVGMTSFAASLASIYMNSGGFLPTIMALDSSGFHSLWFIEASNLFAFALSALTIWGAFFILNQVGEQGTPHSSE